MRHETCVIYDNVSAQSGAVQLETVLLTVTKRFLDSREPFETQIRYSDKMVGNRRMINVPTPIGRESSNASAEQGRLMLWIDGVGAYLLCLGQRVSIGGPAVESNPAEIALLANLSRRHATFVRNGEGYLLEAHSPTRVAGRSIDQRTYLNDGYILEFGDSVRLRFRLPSVLSTSARLEFLSNHRPAYNVDGVILMDESCLIGPGAENHVHCADWPESIVLFLREREFYCKARSSLFIDGVPAGNDSAIAPGKIVTGTDFCFRIETLD